MIFKGDYFFLSNFYPAKVSYQGRVFPSSEHAYVSMKFSEEFRDQFVDPMMSAGQAKRIGRTSKLRFGWAQRKNKIMFHVVEAKFRQNPDLANMLIRVQGEIVEHNTHRDRYWGVFEGDGKNHLGIILMQIRQRLIQELVQ